MDFDERSSSSSLSSPSSIGEATSGIGGDGEFHFRPETVRYFAISAACFVGVHALAKRFWASRLTKEKLASLSRKQLLNMAEKTVSSTHGAVVGFAGLYGLVIGMHRTGDIFSPWPHPNLLDFTFSTVAGYSLYDTLFMLYKGDEPVGMYVHHLVSLTGAMLIMQYRVASFFPFAFCITELTTLPHNAIWYLTFFGKQDTRLYYYMVLFRAIFWGGVRVPVTLDVLLKCLKEPDFLAKFSALPFLVKAGTGFNVSFLSFMNVYWWTILIGKYFALRKRFAALKQS